MNKLPKEWVNKLFYRLKNIYGMYYSHWFSTHEEVMKESWSSGLYGLNAEEIKKGLDHCHINSNARPPTCVEFYHHCKGIPLIRETIKPSREKGLECIKQIKNDLSKKYRINHVPRRTGGAEA